MCWGCGSESLHGLTLIGSQLAAAKVLACHISRNAAVLLSTRSQAPQKACICGGDQLPDCFCRFVCWISSIFTYLYDSHVAIRHMHLIHENTHVHVLGAFLSTCRDHCIYWSGGINPVDLTVFLPWQTAETAQTTSTTTKKSQMTFTQRR